MEATLGPYQIEVADDFGPRITSLRLDDGPEMLVHLPPDAVISDEGWTFVLRGGHRLWASPEIPAITYAPDDHPCRVSEVDGSLVVVAPPDAAGLIKEIAMSIEDDTLVVDHRLTSSGFSGAVAPWAITQFPPGGTAILPLTGQETAPLPNRYLVLWPYSSVEDRRVILCDDVLELEAAEGPPLKFGSGPASRRLGYFRDGLVFLKDAETGTGREVPDYGAGAQIYLESGFCELESVGALIRLSEGHSVTLRERWTVLDCGDLDAAIRLVVGS